MKLYDSYAECKLANPNCEVYTCSGKFATSMDVCCRMVNDLIIESWEKCNPKDYLMTVEEFLAREGKLKDGDIVITIPATIGLFLDGDDDSETSFVIEREVVAIKDKPEQFTRLTDGSLVTVRDPRKGESVFSIRNPFNDSVVTLKHSTALNYSIDKLVESVCKCMHNHSEIDPRIEEAARKAVEDSRKQAKESTLKKQAPPNSLENYCITRGLSIETKIDSLEDKGIIARIIDLFKSDTTSTTHKEENKLNKGFELMKESEHKHKHHDLIVEWAKDTSKVVQMNVEGMWFNSDMPCWNEDVEYRFKPNPKDKPKLVVGHWYPCIDRDDSTAICQ